MSKAAHKDISAELDNQGKLYARSLRPEDAAHALGVWGAYRVPFVFATNGRPWLEQFQTKSGIWFCDVRHSASIPRALQGWISPQGMKELFLKDEAAGNRALQAMPLDLLTDANGLNLREYQLRAITAAEQAIIGGRKTALLAMATGTGKTRTVLGMIYRFLKTGRFRRVLFLVDRTALGQQAQDVFQDVKLEDLLPLADIYTIKSLDDTDIDPETRVQIATVQGMVKRVLYNNGEKMPAVTDYDLIIVDEAHRGYILDKGMSDSEYACRDQRDYQGKYRAVIDYFDAVKIALTATPALQTTEIFGEPVFAYTYREAVVDGYLVDHDAPHRIATVLNTGGIHYKPGETLVLYDPVTGEVTNSDKLDDELDFDVEHFNRQVVNDNFNRAVLHEIARHIDPEDPMAGKTLIYAVNDQHADTIVQILKEYYGNLGVNTDAIMKITGAVGGGNRNAVLEAIRHYKNEQFPSIAVTVDLLTTGLDVPEITTLVFMRCVRSRILFEQMLGRATRLCPRIRKQCFTIYDAVGVYETLLPVSTMKPVVANPGATLPQLLDELETLDDSARIRAHNEQILARLQRRRNNMDSGELEHFASMSGGRQPTQLLNEFKRLAHDPQTLKTTLLAHRELLEWLQGVTRPRTPVVIDNTPDAVTSHTRGFGEGNTRPEDYLHAFAAWLTANMDNVAALGIVCTRPRDLTRQALKELRLKLEREGFSAQRLNDAVNATSNTAMTVDIITLIRRYALGAALVDHEQRIRHAVDRIRASYNLSAMARKWLERIEAWLMHESVLQTAVFDEDPRFRERGGFAGLDRIFEGQLQAIVNDINTHLYDDGGAAA